jgi:hypothetical protein
MTRTINEARRRQSLADAASGIPRTHVVLWAPPFPGWDTELVLGTLRRYADARDWVCLDETASDDWALVERILTAEQADGVVVPSRAMCENEGLQAWLDRGPVFVCEAMPKAAR